jgi:hypothetical protein
VHALHGTDTPGPLSVCGISRIGGEWPVQQFCEKHFEEQSRDDGRLVEETIARIDAGQFLPHSGIRFPQNGCVGCPFLGLCLNQSELVDAKLVRVPGASDLDWLDELDV